MDRFYEVLFALNIAGGSYAAFKKQHFEASLGFGFAALWFATMMSEIR